MNQLKTADLVVGLASEIFARHSTRITFDQSLQLARDIIFYTEEEQDESAPDSSDTFWDGVE
jgi:hypothetical protein